MRKIFLFAAVLLSAVLLKTSTFIVSCTEIDPYSDSEYVEDDILNEVQLCSFVSLFLKLPQLK